MSPLKALGAFMSRRTTANLGPDSEPLLREYRGRGLPNGWRIILLLVLAIACVAYGFYFAALAPARMMPFTVPPVILAVLIIWALPAGDYAPVRALEPIYLCFLAALVMWPNYLAIALPSLPWMTLLRIVVVPLIVVFLICLSVSHKFRTLIGDILSADSMLWKMLIAYSAIQLATLPLSSDIGDSFNKIIVAQCNWTAIFFASCALFRRPGFVTFWVAALLSMCTVDCFIGLWEHRLGYVPWAGHIPSFLRVDDPAVQRILAGGFRAATKVHRVAGTATTPLGLAELLGLTAPFAMHFVLGRYPLYIRLALLLYIPLVVYVILLTDSRLGVVACLVSVLLYLLIWAAITWRQERENLFAPAIVFTYPAIFSGFVAATFFIGRLHAMVWGTGAQQASTDSRIDQWNMAIPKIIQNPFGHGFGMGARTLGFTNGDGVLTIDSYYLSTLLEVGVLGTLIYYGMFVRAVWTGARTVIESPPSREIRMLMPIAVSLSSFIVVKSVFSQDANHALVFMMLGAVVALAYRARSENNTAPGLSPETSGTRGADASV
jgi:hypothetical protein